MAESICPNCGQSIDVHDDICEKCGAGLTPKIPPPTFARSVTASTVPGLSSASTLTVCPNCHTPIRAGEDICEHCGAVLATVAPSTQAASATVSPPETCPQCHTPRVPGVKFCNRCGFRYATVTSPAASSAMSAANQANAPALTTHLTPGSILT